MGKIKIKETYLLFLIVIGLVSLSLYSTYALFTASTEITDVVSFNTSLTTDSSILEYEMITIPAGESKIIEINANNSHTDTIYYGIWYQLLTSNSDINIGIYSEKNNTPASGNIVAGGSVTVLVGITNNGEEEVILNIGAVGSETSNLNLASSRVLVTGVWAPPTIVTDDILEENTITPEETINLEYTTASKQQISLEPGEYKLEVWGGQGGSYNSSYGVGGKGGYSYGTLTLTETTTLYVYPGGQGSYYTTSTYTSQGSGGFNGGGNVGYRGGSGGGSSDIRIGTDSTLARVIVAGGGGGAYSYSSTYKANGGYGGGTSGGAGSYYNSTYSAFAGGGATQTTGGSAGTGSSANYNGSAGTFGSGGKTGYKYSNTSYYSNGAGGGGWYGGGGAGNYSGTSRTRAAGGGGGSGYVYTSETASNYPSGCLLNPSYYLKDAATFGGNQSFKDFNGSTVTGHSGNGAARISGVQTGVYTIPVISGLNDIRMYEGSSEDLDAGVKYTCENDQSSCQYLGHDNIDTASLTEGNYTVNYTIKAVTGQKYIYQRNIIVVPLAEAYPVVNGITTTSVKSDSISFTINASDDKNEIATYHCSKDDGSTYTSSSTNSCSFTGLTAATTYNIKVYVLDKDGYQSEIYSENIKTKNPSYLFYYNESDYDYNYDSESNEYMRYITGYNIQNGEVDFKNYVGNTNYSGTIKVDLMSSNSDYLFYYKPSSYEIDYDAEENMYKRYIVGSSLDSNISSFFVYVGNTDNSGTIKIDLMSANDKYLFYYKPSAYEMDYYAEENMYKRYIRAYSLDSNISSFNIYVGNTDNSGSIEINAIAANDKYLFYYKPSSYTENWVDTEDGDSYISYRRYITQYDLETGNTEIIYIGSTSKASTTINLSNIAANDKYLFYYDPSDYTENWVDTEDGDSYIRYRRYITQYDLETGNTEYIYVGSTSSSSSTIDVPNITVNDKYLFYYVPSSYTEKWVDTEEGDSYIYYRRYITKYDLETGNTEEIYIGSTSSSSSTINISGMTAN